MNFCFILFLWCASNEHAEKYATTKRQIKAATRLYKRSTKNTNSSNTNTRTRTHTHAHTTYPIRIVTFTHTTNRKRGNSAVARLFCGFVHINNWSNRNAAVWVRVWDCVGLVCVCVCVSEHGCWCWWAVPCGRDATLLQKRREKKGEPNNRCIPRRAAQLNWTEILFAYVNKTLKKQEIKQKEEIAKIAACSLPCPYPCPISPTICNEQRPFTAFYYLIYSRLQGWQQQLLTYIYSI